ncbi:MAG TPA: SulP family inorganic anion transporter, partial [Euzebyales bacterium]
MGGRQDGSAGVRIGKSGSGGCTTSMPTGGSLTRTGISVGGGADGRWGRVFAAVWLALLVLLLGDLAEAVPLSVIAGLLFVIGAELIIDRLAVARLTEHTSTGSLVVMLTTFGTALFIPLQWTIF